MAITGKYLSMEIGVATLAGVHSWDVDETADEIEATTGADNGRGRKDVGVVDTVANVVLYLDITSGLYTALRAGATLSNVKLYADKDADDPLYTFSAAKAFGLKLGGRVRDKFEVTGKIIPTGDVITAAEPN
jgi:hypothetical protein